MSKFKFGFSSEDDCKNTTNFVEPTKGAEDLKWIDAKELLFNECPDISPKNKEKLILKANDVTIHYISYSEDFSDQTSETCLFMDDHCQSDLIPAKYEGGMKVWECTFDLATYLTSPEKPVNLEHKTVLDLGCGVGILGLVSLSLGASTVHFQDYNEEVLQKATIPNLTLNSRDNQSLCKFFSGDWESFSDLNDVRYDIILSSETIYNDNNYHKLHNTLQKKLKQDGVIFLAAKTYYFGVGGGTRLFETIVKEENVFDVSVCWECSTGVHREILKLKFKNK